MGLEANCKVRLSGQASVGKAHCGDGEIDFKGDFRFRWYWRELTGVEVVGGTLKVTKDGQTAEFDLGDRADKWAHAIRNPKSRLDKLGLKAGMRYQAHGEFDDLFPIETSERAGDESQTELDLVFVRLDSHEDLNKVLDARQTIVQNGGIWAVWPKGRKEFREDDIRAFALASGLVDVKVASFSDKLSALKLVIPSAMRR